MPDLRTVYHCAIIQECIADQLCVLEWIRGHPEMFKAIWILHYKDFKPSKGEEPEETNDSEQEEIDDSEQEENEHEYDDSSGLVKAHFHLLIKVNKKQSPASITHSFANYVHFRRCSSPHMYFQYLMHRDFKSSFYEYKSKYDISELQTNDDNFLNSFLLGPDSQDTDLIERIAEYFKQTGTIYGAFRLALELKDYPVIREIKGNAYFYSRFFASGDN